MYQLKIPLAVSICTALDNWCMDGFCTEKSHHAHLSLEQRILAFEKECEERSNKKMEEKV